MAEILGRSDFMATTTTCDKCGKELTEHEKHKLIFAPPYPVFFGDKSKPCNQEEYDLCERCRDQLFKLVEDFTPRSEEREDNL